MNFEMWVLCPCLCYWVSDRIDHECYLLPPKCTTEEQQDKANSNQLSRRFGILIDLISLHLYLWPLEI